MAEPAIGPTYAVCTPCTLDPRKGRKFLRELRDLARQHLRYQQPRFKRSGALAVPWPLQTPHVPQDTRDRLDVRAARGDAIAAPLPLPASPQDAPQLRWRAFSLDILWSTPSGRPARLLATPAGGALFDPNVYGHAPDSYVLQDWFDPRVHTAPWAESPDAAPTLLLLWKDALDRSVR